MPVLNPSIWEAEGLMTIPSATKGIGAWPKLSETRSQDWWEKEEQGETEVAGGPPKWPLLPKLTTGVRSPGPTRWKEGENEACKLPLTSLCKPWYQSVRAQTQISVKRSAILDLFYSVCMSVCLYE